MECNEIVTIYQAANSLPGLRQPGVFNTPASNSPGLGHNSQQNFLATPGNHTCDELQDAYDLHNKTSFKIIT